MLRVRLITFARVVSFGLCTTMVLESPARASPYAGSLRLFDVDPDAEVLVQPVPGQTPPPVVIKDTSQKAQETVGSAPVIAPTGGLWMQPQIQVIVQPQIQVQAAPRGDASPNAVASSAAETASEAETAVKTDTDTASEVVALPGPPSAVATSCPVAPVQSTAEKTPPAPGSDVPNMPPPRSYAPQSAGYAQVGTGMMLFLTATIGVGAIAGMHHAQCSRGKTKHCDRSLSLMAIPVVGPLMTAREAGEFSRGHVVVGVMQGAAVLMLLAGAFKIARDRRRALSEDGIRVGKNTAIRAGSGLTLTTRF